MMRVATLILNGSIDLDFIRSSLSGPFFVDQKAQKNPVAILDRHPRARPGDLIKTGTWRSQAQDPGIHLEQSPLFCADGAYDKVRDLGLNVMAVIGDFDSVSDQTDTTVEWVHKPDQDYTDAHKAFNYLVEQGFKKANVYGASGGALDHQLGNISVAARFMHKLKITFYDAHQTYFLADQNVQLDVKAGDVVSLLPFPEATGVSATGLKHTVGNLSGDLGQATWARNVVIDTPVKVSLSSGRLLVVLS
jgi:thiamine pyrophosphokinase